VPRGGEDAHVGADLDEHDLGGAGGDTGDGGGKRHARQADGPSSVSLASVSRPHTSTSAGLDIALPEAGSSRW
jgi:hypothetical protein